ncbi:MAG: TonB-dependent receptor plug [Bacteroidetes bacterium]|nr:TonB-dependent receptor plug [Bacteroidota bacterium]
MNKKLLPAFIILFLCVVGAFGQTITVINEENKLPVSYSFLSIKNVITAQVQQFQTDDIGQVNLSDAVLYDSAQYIAEMKSIGFHSFLKKLSGKELKKINLIYLTPDHVKLGEVVVTAQYTPTLAEKSVQKIKVIDAKKIEAMGATNLKDVLSNEMNIRLSQDNILGAGMEMECIGGENVKILIDGVPVIGRMNGNIDLSQINLNNIERIEIVEGPLSVQYGTNALAGTINLITKKTFKNKYDISISPYYESIGTYNLRAAADASFKKSSLSVSLSRNYFDGWNPGDKLFTYERTHPADTTRVQQWKSKEQYQGTIGYTYRLKNVQLGYSGTYFNEKIINRGMPRAPYYETAFDDHYYTTRFDNSISLTGKLAGHWYINSSNAYNYYKRIKNTFYKDLTNLNEVLTGTPSDQDTSAYSLIMSRSTFSHTNDSAKLNYEFGYDINYESALGQRISNNIRYMGDFAVFATAEYKPFDRLIVKPGLRYTYNTSYRSPLTPSLSVKYEINKNNTLRASYARGFRAPDLKELYFYFVDINHDIIGNPDLKAEQSNNYSISYANKKEIRNATFRTDASVFYNDIFNLITLAQINAVQYSYINIGHYRTLGGGINENVTVKNLRITAGILYSGRYNQLSETENVYPYSYSPEVNASAIYFFSKLKTSISFFYKYNGKLPGYALTDNVVTQTYIGDYQLLDASVSKNIWKERLSIVMGCKNIMDVKNISANYAAGVHSGSASSVAFATGRNYFIKLTLKLWKEH